MKINKEALEQLKSCAYCKNLLCNMSRKLGQEAYCLIPVGFPMVEKPYDFKRAERKYYES